MDDCHPHRFQQDPLRQEALDAQSADVMASQPKTLPPRKRRKYVKGRQTPKLRASNACDACRQRKSRCSGPPGPCTICNKFDAICIFHPDPESRRRSQRLFHATLRTQKAILERVFLTLKHNKPEDVLTFILLIRSHAPLEEILAQFQANLQSLELHGFLDNQTINDADFIALVPQCLMNSQVLEKEDLPGGCIEQDFPMAGSCVTDSDVRNVDHDMTLGIGPNDDMILAPDGSVAWELLSSYLAYQHPNGFLESFGVDDHDSLFQTPHQTLDITETSTMSIPGRSFGHHTSSDKDCTSTSMSNLRGRSTRVASDGASMRGLESGMDRSILSFVGRAHQQMSMGVTLDELKGFGKADCELLFRDRTVQDAHNIPNWACEEASQFSYLLPEMRIALALCLMRFIPCLICPSATTLSALPGMLRPTKLQRRLAHHVEYDFVPIPKLRDCLIDRPREWITQLGIHECRVKWSGVFGDTGGAELSVAGNWKSDPHAVLMEQLRPEETYNEAKQAKIIVRDPHTARCYISQHFEQACWEFQNWTIDRSVLKVWPDLHGHIRLQ